MAWIQTISPDDSDGYLAETFSKISGSRGKVSNIMRIHSLLPKTMRTHMDFYLSVMFDRTGLSRKEREIIATAVSVTNVCDYCENHHAEALRAYWDDDRVQSFVESLRSGDVYADLEAREKALVEYGIKLTKTPGAMKESDVATLREAELSDQEILGANLVVGYFNFVNRLAVGLGVKFTAEEMSGYNY